MGKKDYVAMAKQYSIEYENASRAKNINYEIEIIIKVVLLIYDFDKNFPLYKNACDIKDKILNRTASDNDFSTFNLIISEFVRYLDPDGLWVS